LALQETENDLFFQAIVMTLVVAREGLQTSGNSIFMILVDDGD
jgi:hypothetical protein